MNRRSHIAILGAVATALASSTLSALFADAGWIPHVVGVIASVTLGGELGAAVGRRFGAALALRAVGALTGAVFFICAVFAHPASPLGFIPTHRSWGWLANDWHAGISDMRDLSPKVPTHLGLTLFAVTGVAAVAFAVNMMVSHAALAGLPLLTLFVVPVALAPGGVGLLPFVLAAVGYLVLLAAEGRERAERWGRSMPSRRSNVAAGYGQSGRRIGVTAVALAVFLPLVVPGLHADRLISNGDVGIGTGPNGVAANSLSPLAKIKGRLTTQARSDYFTYTSSDGKPQYTRIVVDDLFDGTQFLNSGMDSAQRAANLKVDPHGLSRDVARQPVQVTITMKNLREKFLPVPIPLASVTGIPDKWRFDNKTDTIFAAHADTSGLVYTAESVDIAPTADQLRASQPTPLSDPYFSRYLALPVGLDKELGILAANASRVTDAAPTAYAKAKLLEKWFSSSGGFVYDTQGPTGLEQNALTEFLQNKHGYCVQFASSMALMARLLHIPSRVDVGFTGGTARGSGTFVVASTDSHAWPELYFDGIGWVRFEPTPATGTVAPSGAFVTTDPFVRPTAFPGPQATTLLHPETGYVAPSGPIKWGPIVQTTLVIIFVLLLGLPALASRWRRRRAWAKAGTDPRARAHAAWREVLVTAENVGHRFDPGMSIRGKEAALAERAELSRIAQGSLATLARAEEYALYAKSAPPGDPDIDASARIVTDSLLSAASRMRRVQAMVVPPETLRVWRSGVGGALTSTFEAVDRLSAWVTSPFVRRRTA